MKDKEYFKNLASQLMFNLSDEEASDIESEFKTLSKQLELLEAIDTKGVEPLVYPFDIETTYLRDDEVTNVISVEDALSNVSDSKEGHFVVHKVVK